ncbi:MULTISPECIES: hypothetical protein [Flavobacterium]|uniref:Uncharacterized protein n=1 Tax=Flavobacterium jumunjinense TaxID=998845 RepID=A0ABV5GLJ1_9FLAO|nr:MULTISPECIES: hypothetical protein [Flavobacterium]
MKKFIFFSILFSAFGFSQSKDPKIVLPDLNTISINEPFTFEVLNFFNSKSKPLFLSIYDSNLDIQSNYLKTKNNYSLSYINHNLNTNKIDSLNPSGANDMGAALIFGAVNYILKSDITFQFK